MPASIPGESDAELFSPRPTLRDQLEWRRAPVVPGDGASRTEAPRTLPRVIALREGLAVREELDRTGRQAAGVHGVPAREVGDLEPVVRDLRMEDVDRRG